MSDTIIEKHIDVEMTMDDALKVLAIHKEKIAPIKKEIINELRGLRTNIISEVAVMIKPLEDIRNFFIGDDHDKEIVRLREFVDLCERIGKLKKSGLLDAVSDTILKLSESNEA